MNRQEERELKLMSELLMDEQSSVAAISAAALFFRKVFANRQGPSTSIIISNTHVIPALIRGLERFDLPDLQVNISWALTNVACGTQEDTHRLVEEGGTEALLRVMVSGTNEAKDQAIWALGNIAADCLNCRQMLQNTCFVDTLLELLERPRELQERQNESVSPLLTVVWSLGNMLRNGGSHFLSTDQILSCVRVISSLFSSVFILDLRVFADSSWIVAYIADNQTIGIPAILADVCLMRQLSMNLQEAPDRKVLAGSLRTIGNLISGTDQQTAAVINYDVLPSLVRLLSQSSGQIRREAAWALSNIAAGPPDQIGQLLTSDVLDALFDGYYNGETKVKKECAWAVTNAVSGAEENQISWLTMRGTLSLLCRLLTDYRDSRLLDRAMDALRATVEQDRAFREAMYRYGGVTALRRVIDGTNDAELAVKGVQLLADLFTDDKYPPNNHVDVYTFVRSS